MRSRRSFLPLLGSELVCSSRHFLVSLIYYPSFPIIFGVVCVDRYSHVRYFRYNLQARGTDTHVKPEPRFPNASIVSLAYLVPEVLNETGLGVQDADCPPAFGYRSGYDRF